MTSNVQSCMPTVRMLSLGLWAVRDLTPPGELTSPQTHPFEFANVEMQYDSYRGLQVRLRWACPHRRLVYSVRRVRKIYCCLGVHTLTED